MAAKLVKTRVLEKARFCKAHAGAKSLLRRKSGIVTQKRPSWCIDRDHKKEVVSVRVMRKSFTPFGHFFEGKIKWHLCFATLTSENVTGKRHRLVKSQTLPSATTTGANANLLHVGMPSSRHRPRRERGEVSRAVRSWPTSSAAAARPAESGRTRHRMRRRPLRGCRRLAKSAKQAPRGEGWPTRTALLPSFSLWAR